MHDRSIAVFGSLNVDLVTRLEHFPRPGETVAARSFAMYPGGKGANQAVACGRLGSAVSMYGALGDDVLAERLRASLGGAGVDASAVEKIGGVATGTANIWVDDAGENMIAIAAGANGRVDVDYVDRHAKALGRASYLLLQLEVPLATLAHLLRQLPDSGGPRVVLDPAPARSVEALPLERVWLITPNEHELATLTGLPTEGVDQIRRAASALRERTRIRRVLTKAGARGAYLLDDDGFEELPGFAVEAVDSTAAGDAFNGALASALAEASDDTDGFAAAVRSAHAAAAITVTRPGAQPAMASRSEVERFLAERQGEPNGRPGGPHEETRHPERPPE